MAGYELKLDLPGFEKLTKDACDKAAEKAASKIITDAKMFLMSEAKDPTGKLKSEINLEKSKFKGGGVAIEAQGPRNRKRFYATFVELGSIRNPRPIPYLRTPLNSNRKYIKGLFKDLV